jgi:uncharacterized protein (TIGR02231 family)
MSMRLMPPKIPTLMLISLSALYATPSLAASRVASVTVYPGSAAVDRVTSIDASTRKVVFDCLPAGLDTQSLQIESDADVRVGEMSIKTVAREQSSCAAHPLDSQIRALEDQKAALQAESDALDLVKCYLKGVSATSDDTAATSRPRSSDGKTIASTIETLHHSGQSAYLRQYQLTQQMADLDRSLQPLIAERGRSQPKGQVKSVTASIYAPRGATVHLRYQVRGPNWSPAYRALLDTQTNKLKIERQAMVSQATGEDWTGVKLLLSTGQPNANAAGPTPWPWNIGIQPPPQAERYSAKAYGGAMPAAAPVSPTMYGRLNTDAEEPNYAVSVVNYGYTTEFNIPGNIDVPSSGEKVAFSLGQTDQAAKLLVRTSPAQDANAYLLAEVTQPEGIWPVGPIQLYRDGAFVGSSTMRFDSDDVEDVESKTSTASNKLTLSFGRDELVRVVAEPVQDSQSIVGLTGSRRERHVVHGYVVQNKHSQLIHAQILEAAPVATDDSIQIKSVFQPAPATQKWRKQQGVTLWKLDIPANQRTRVTADYTISSPKDAVLTGQ